MIVVSRSSGDGGKMGKTPVVNAIQRRKSGPYDGHIVLLEMP